ncbi:unnamed protein product [Pylaiella littoralis]
MLTRPPPPPFFRACCRRVCVCCVIPTIRDASLLLHIFRHVRAPQPGSHTRRSKVKRANGSYKCTFSLDFSFLFLFLYSSSYYDYYFTISIFIFIVSIIVVVSATTDCSQIVTLKYAVRDISDGV